MRVPVYPDDLSRIGGFKRIAKKLQKLWPGNVPLRLSYARETLARGLGYDDFHDVTTVSKTCAVDAHVPPVADAHAGIMKAVSDVLFNTENMKLQHDALLSLIKSLPIFTLSAFKHRKPAPLSHSPLTTTDLKSIVDGITNLGNLRDLALLELLLTGMRAQNFLSLTVNDLTRSVMSTDDRGFMEMRLQIAEYKSPGDADKVAVVPADAIQRYIESEGLSGKDYLFPAGNTGRPMSPERLGKICRNWAVMAKLNDVGISPQAFRFLVATQHFKNPMSDIWQWMGHNSPLATLTYLSAFPKTKK